MIEIPVEITTIIIAVCMAWLFGSSAVDRAERRRPARRIEPQREKSAGGLLVGLGLVIAGIFFLSN